MRNFMEAYGAVHSKEAKEELDSQRDPISEMNTARLQDNDLRDLAEEVLEEGAQIFSDLNKKHINMIGHVTSRYFSPNLNKSIALAVVRSGKKLKGQKLIVPMENKNINVTVSDFVFLDKENKRLNA